MAEKKEDLEEKMPVQEPSTAEDMPSPSAEVTVTETTVTPSMPRSREWMQSKYPDKLWESDEAFDEDVATRLAEDDERLATYAASDERIARILDLNPDFWKVLDAMDKGMPFMTALRTYAGDLVEAIPAEGDEGFEEYQKAAEEYLAEKKRSDERIAERNTNLEKSNNDFVAFVDANLPEEKRDAFVQFVQDNLNALDMGIVSDKFMRSMLDAFNYDEDIEDAKEAGAIEARNTKITAERIKAENETDGLPMGGGTSPIVEEEQPSSRSILEDIVDGYKRRL